MHRIVYSPTSRYTIAKVARKDTITATQLARAILKLSKEASVREKQSEEKTR